jgi:hypothetical protein
MIGVVALELWVVQRMRIGEAVKLGEAVQFMVLCQ